MYFVSGYSLSRTAIVLVFLLTAGCVAATFPVGDQELAAPFQEDTLEQLLASNQEDVREALGAPTYELTEEEADKSYFVYEGEADVFGIGIIGFFPLARRSRTGTHCSLLEFGADHRLQRFATERAGGEFWLLMGPLHRAPKNCRHVFWSQEKRARLQTVAGTARPRVQGLGEPAVQLVSANLDVIWGIASTAVQVPAEDIKPDSPGKKMPPVRRQGASLAVGAAVREKI
jgi:hypothetical protein